MNSSRGMKMVQLVTANNEMSPGTKDSSDQYQTVAHEVNDNNDDFSANDDNYDSNEESELDEEQTHMAEEMIDLFGSDLSDDDPTFKPHKSPANSSTSEDSHPSRKFSAHEGNNDILSDCPNYDLFGKEITDSLSSLLQHPLESTDKIRSLHDNEVTKESQLPVDPLYYDIRLPEAFQIAEIILNEVFQNAWKSIRPLKRWRTADPTNWAINIAKQRRMEGLPYNLKNKTLPPKIPKPIDCDTCKYKCTLSFSSEDRSRLCRHYWTLDFKGKKNFLLSNVKIQPLKRRLCTLKPNRQPRSYSKNCFLSKDDVTIQICQKFLCKTLCISPDVIQEAIKARNELGLYIANDKRGRKEPPNKTKPEVIGYVKSHIESFPCMEAHYVRKYSKRKYLDQQLSIKKMYQLYLESCNENGIADRVSEITYRRIFCHEYNLSFFVPKKDQCLICTNYNKASTSSKADLELSYTQHIERKNKCNDEKNKDKERANRDKSYMSVTFDMQGILQIPSGNVGLLYYTRKLCVYNLTIYEAPLPNAGYCLSWSEVNGKKGSCEVGSALYYYLKNCLSHDVRELSLYSDTCGGQNRNQYVAALLLWAVQKIDHLHVIEQKFLESGHSYMEADSMHSSIEHARKHTSIYGMPDWLSIFQRARRQKTRMVDKEKMLIKPYNVKEFKFDEFFDLKTHADNILVNKTKDNNGNKVKWLKIKIMRYIKGEPDKIYFNYDMSDSFLYINVATKNNPVQSRSYSTRNKNRSAQPSPAVQSQTPCSDIQLEPLYGEPLPISVAKKNDLVKLCNKKVIPEEFHGWFNSLATASTVVDRLPEAAIDESSDEESWF